MTVFACTKDLETEMTPVKNSEVHTYTMSITAGKGEANTKTLEATVVEGKNTIVATWSENDGVIVYKGESYLGTLIAQSSGASTTLSGSVSGSINPDDVLTLKYQSPSYTTQNGTLTGNDGSIDKVCDYAVATVTVNTVSAGSITIKESCADFVNQQAIVEFTLKESDGTAISDGVINLTVNVVGTEISVTPSSATDVLYVAVPAINNGAVSISAVDNNGAPRSYSKAEASFENGKYYQIGVNMDCIVKDYNELRAAAMLSLVPKITLGADITFLKPSSLNSRIEINRNQVIDLNSHTITGHKGGSNDFDRIFYVNEGKSLTINGPGTLKDGFQEYGGAIYNAGSLVINNVSITGCSADFGGAIYNAGTLTVTDCSIKNNIAGYNNGGGIYNAGTLKMSGHPVVIGNSALGGAEDNVHLASGKVITVDGAFTEGARIGITLADGSGAFTSGYSTFNTATNPSAVFTDDAVTQLVLISGDEAALAPYRYVGKSTYDNLSVLLEETGLLSMLGNLGLWYIGQYISTDQQNTPVSAFTYTYLSADPQGKPVELSALMYVPDAAFSGTDLSGMCLTNHGTIAKNAQCPTLSAQFEGAFAWKNYAIIMPDYYGFGVSADRPQGYLDADNTAHNSIDAYRAAVQVLKDRGAAIPDNLYSFGYSQGGFNSMANLKYVSQHPELGITFKKVFCGGSPFDVMVTWNAYANGTFHNSLAFVPMTLVSINETHNLGLSYSDLFLGALRNNWQNWILYKNYTTDEITQLLVDNEQDTISKILTSNMISGTGNAFNAIKTVCEHYSLTSGWTPPASGTAIYLYHSENDDTVPYSNLKAMTDFLDSKAPGCYEQQHAQNGGHMNAILSYVIYVLNKW